MLNRRKHTRRRQVGDGDSFGMSLMDLLTAALGCVLLIFIVYSVVTSGDLARFLSANKDLVASLQERDTLIALKKKEAAQFKLLIAKLERNLSDKDKRLLEQETENKLALDKLKKNRTDSIRALLTKLTLLQGALDPQTAKPVDVMLVIDGTNSMEPSLAAVRQNLRAIIGALQVLSPTARIGIAVYRDQNERPKIRLEYQSLSSNAERLRKFLIGIKAKSTKRDKDRPEWMCGGLRAAILGKKLADYRLSNKKLKRLTKKQKSPWREDAIKLVVVVSDAGANSKQANECIRVAQQFKAQGGQVHIVSTLPRGYGKKKGITKEYDDIVLKEHSAIAKAGGGEHIKRASESTLLEEVLRTAFRSRIAELERLKEVIKQGESMAKESKVVDPPKK